MALFDKIFFTKRKLDGDICESRDRGRSSQIVPEQVRLLLFKECDWRGRKLLFDSSTIVKVPACKNDAPNVKQTSELPCIVEVTDGFTYLYKGPAADANLLGEMIFGAVAMNYKGVSLKIHIMDDPRRFMCTKVFCVPSFRRINRADKKNIGACSSGDLHKGSKPLNVPLQKEEGVSLSFSLDRGDSGYCGDPSPHSSVSSTYEYFSMFDLDGSCTRDDLYTFHSPPGRKLSTSSNGSWQRRTFRNIATRFELSSTNLLNVPSTATSCSSQIYSNSSASGTSDSLASTGSSVITQRKNKLGLALLITVGDEAQMEVIRKCVEHSPQLQSLICRLRAATVCAGAGGGFMATLHRATSDTARWLSDFMYGPRLQPTWLNLVTNEAPVTNKMAETLLSDICSVLSVGDTKNTNFFISTLLTHVLTYHLGWVTTVSPYDTLDPQKHQTKEHHRPYNALWAQLNDLCGSIGFPPRAAKTIISGAKNRQFVNRLLAVLTYFVRCGDVTRNEFQPQECVLKESKVISINKSGLGLKRTATQSSKLAEFDSMDCLKVPSINNNNSDSSVSTLIASEVGVKRTFTLGNLSEKLSNSMELSEGEPTACDKPSTCSLRRNTTVLLPVVSNSDSSESSLSDSEAEQKVVFVLGDDEKLVGLKNKSNGGKSVKKSSKIHNEPINLEVDEKMEFSAKDDCETKNCDRENCTRTTESPSRCCSQTLQHSKPIKHSGFKFEFDKYPQIVTNYMKSKNLEILDRHYIGKPGNLKLDNFQFDPTVVPPIQEEKCETCYQCQLLESMLQTPTNASEFEYMNDVPRNTELQYATETFIKESDSISDTSPKTFIRQRKKSTILVNVVKRPEDVKSSVSVEVNKTVDRRVERSRDRLVDVKEVIEFPVRAVSRARLKSQRVGYDASLLGGITDHYVPDLVLQGTIAKPSTWENELRKDLELASCVNKCLDSPVQAVAIVGDTNTWQVEVLGGAGGCGMSALVGGMLDALPAMCRANVPAQQCLTFLESKLREFCVLSKTLADMLMSTDFCDIATLTKSLNIDINDVPLLLAVATTHTPQVATRYGISYR